MPACYNRRQLTNESRLDIIRTLVSLTISKFGPEPTKHQLEEVARKLVLKYPFMKDDLGNGYVSSSRYTHTYILYIFVAFLGCQDVGKSAECCQKVIKERIKTN